MMTRAFCQEPDYPPPGFEKVELVQSRIVSLSIEILPGPSEKDAPAAEVLRDKPQCLRGGGCKLFCAISH